MKEIGEQVIVPRLLLPNGLMMNREKGRRTKRRIKMERMIILLLIGIPRMILRIHRIGTFPLLFLSSAPWRSLRSLTIRSLMKKSWTTFCIMLITTSVYMGSSIVSPAITEFSSVFGVGSVTATLTLSLFVVGYGVGPLFLSPISEIPQIGRSIPYIVTLALFCILQVPTALVNNFAGLVSLPLPPYSTRKLTLQCILRFLAGFIGSPPLATGGASLQDVFHPTKLPYAMGLYGLAAASGPALAPVISGYAVVANGWRWAFWIMLWLSGFSLALLAFTMPEVSLPLRLVARPAHFLKQQSR
jgi:DHA1 family multidrug resistance protein-like MFS transporter